MKGTALVLNVALAGAIAIGATGIQGLHAAEEQEEYKPKVEVTTLLQAPLEETEGKEVIIKHLAIPPGFVGGRHSHPGSVFIYVLEGSLTLEMEGDAPRTINSGELFQEPLQRVMQAKNLSTTDWTKIIVFQVGDVGNPMMIKAD